MKQSSGLKDLPSRFIAHSVGSLLLAFLIIIAAYPTFLFVFAGLISLIAMITLYEYFGLLKEKKLTPAIVLGLFFCGLFVFSQSLPISSPVILALALFSFFLFFGFGKKEPLINIATSFFGLIYIGVPFALMIGIVLMFDGMLSSFWLAYLILVTKSCDMGGYFLGRVFGKHKLALKLSPNKTIEGAIGGIISSCVMAIVMALFQRYFMDRISFSLLLSATLGLLLGIFAGIGDLAESLFKRDAKVKDSNTIPAIGGVLDVVDSLLFTTPLLFIFLKSFVV